MVTDAAGTVAQTNDYTPFGSEFDSAATGVNPGLDHRYGGKEKARFVPDGTVTYFDLWPGEEAGIKNYQETLPANYHTRFGSKGRFSILILRVMSVSPLKG